MLTGQSSSSLTEREGSHVVLWYCAFALAGREGVRMRSKPCWCKILDRQFPAESDKLRSVAPSARFSCCGSELGDMHFVEQMLNCVQAAAVLFFYRETRAKMYGGSHARSTTRGASSSCACSLEIICDQMALKHRSHPSPCFCSVQCLCAAAALCLPFPVCWSWW